MPVISRFYGIVIKMYFLPKEHNPPHVHIIYGEESFSVSIKELMIIDGETNPSSKVLSMARKWIALHQIELLKMWDSQDFHIIEPLW